jgi:uncharacterized protein
MEVQFLDTNLIIRYLTKDNPNQAQRAKKLIQQIQAGLLTVITSEAVICEVVWVLSSRVLYHLPRQDVRTHLTNLLSLKGIRLPYKRTYLRALELYASTNLDFVDVLSVAHMERAKIQTIWSFDQGFDRLQGITRQEP